MSMFAVPFFARIVLPPEIQIVCFSLGLALQCLFTAGCQDNIVSMFASNRVRFRGVYVCHSGAHKIPFRAGFFPYDSTARPPNIFLLLLVGVLAFRKPLFFFN